MLLVAFLFQGTWALAGTTGGLSGSVVNEKGAPIAGAKVSVNSPSQIASTTTDAHGNFVFLSLSPDTYTVSVSAKGYAPITLTGVTVFADQVQRLALRTQSLKTIARVTSRATASNLLSANGGTNVYSVNPAQQAAVQGSGGGYNLNNAYSAIYNTPGVTSFIGNYGWGQVFYIRGANYDQSGFEYDGVPVNRAFDNYQANTLSNLGQQEVQVYSGSGPAGAAAATQVGFINQVIKTGTYPGYGSVTVGLGAPGFYHNLKVQGGGASPNRLFSYYVGLSGTNQVYNTINAQNGGNIPMDGSGPNGLSSVGVNSMYYLNSSTINGNGPWSTCLSNGAPPPNSATPVDTNAGLGGAFAILGLPYTPLGACNFYYPYAVSMFNYYMTQDREAVVNLHFGIPHKHGGGRDDVQLLYSSSAYHSLPAASLNQMTGGNLANLNNAFYGYGGPNGEFQDISTIVNAFNGPGSYPTTYSGQGGPYDNLCAFMGILGNSCATTGASPIPFQDGYIFAPGTQFGQSAATATAQPYYFPSTSTNRGFKSGINPNFADGAWNDIGIFKAQYQKNIGSNAYLRVFGYTFYSDWLMGSASGVAGSYATAFAFPSYNVEPTASDYELSTHTRGLQATYANQINSKNLITLTANYTVAKSQRNYNGGGSGANWVQNNLPSTTPGFSPVTNLSDGTNCYNSGTGALASCYSNSTAGSYGTPVGVAPPPGSPAALAGASYIVTVPGLSGGFINHVGAKFGSLVLADQITPNSRWNISAVLRFDQFGYNLQNLNNPEYNFWFAQAQNTFCVDPATGLPMTVPEPHAPVFNWPLATGYNNTCPVGPSGVRGVNPNGLTPGVPILTNIGPSSLTKRLLEPRLSGTFTLNPDTIIRFAAGRFAQPTATAFEQYAFGSGRQAGITQFKDFYGLGYNTPAHDNPVQTTNNYDISLEKHLKGTDVTFRLTPFYRYAQNQSVFVALGPTFVSGVNVGTEKTTGVEFQLQKGDPSRNGWSGQLSWTYAHARIKYAPIGSAPNAITVLNSYIRAYNGLTSFCASNPTSAQCPQGMAAGLVSTPTNGVVAAPCYNPAAPDPNSPASSGNTGVTCGGPGSSGYITNPYYNSAPQPLLDPNGWYNTYANEPPANPLINPSLTAFGPNQFSAFVSYKKNKLTITPNAALDEGARYGSPVSIIGIDPRACGQNEGPAGAGVVPAGPYANNADYQSCFITSYTGAGELAIPNPTTGTFDGLGQYREPWQLNLGAQVKYDFTPKMSGTLILANLYNRCFGGTSAPWSQAYPANGFVCGYGANTGSYIGAPGGTGSGFYYGASGQDAANGTAGYPGVLNQPYYPLNGALPFQAYFQMNFKI
ncbi:MAG: carboxypeptidase regulatory-like domain-containing protein [Vulcanimicrobiaceae bacterium]